MTLCNFNKDRDKSESFQYYSQLLFTILNQNTLYLKDWILFRFESRQDHSTCKNFSWKIFHFICKLLWTLNWVKWERIGMQMFFATKVFHVALSPLLMLNFRFPQKKQKKKPKTTKMIVNFFLFYFWFECLVDHILVLLFPIIMPATWEFCHIISKMQWLQ